MHHTIYTRGMLMVGVILTTVTLTVTAWIAYEQNQNLTVRARDELDGLARLQAVAVRDALRNLNRDTVQEILLRANTGPDIHSARVFTQDGNVFAKVSGPHKAAEGLLTSSSEITTDDGDTRRSLGQLELTISLTRLGELQRSSLWDVIIIGLIQLIAVILGTGLVLRKIVKPLESIRASLVTLAGGSTDCYIPELGRNDQIGDMARAVRVFRSSLGEIKRLQAKEAEKTVELELARNIADQANRAKSEFLSSMSHELRTPLNSIIGFAQILESDIKEPLSELQREAVYHIKIGGEHLLLLIDDILDLGKIEEGKVEVYIEDVSMNDSIEECINLVKNSALDRDIEISVLGCQEQVLTVRADFRRLRQAILNLLSNAIKYNKDEGKINIELSKTCGNLLKISISDDGIGIPRERHQELFQKFNRLGAEGTGVEGSGIGLILTRELVRLMGGQMGFESEKGLGSTFWFELPLVSGVNSSSVEGVMIMPGRTGDDLHPVFGKILYVEDNLANLKLMKGIVRLTEGLTLISARYAEVGLEMAKTQNPDMIILDINLPGMNGLEALEKLKELGIVPRIPVIALSAAATDKDIQKGLEAGFEMYLTKPINVQQVNEAIYKLVAA